MKIEPGMLVEKADIDAFWVVPEFEGFGIVIGNAPRNPPFRSRNQWYTQFLVLWNDGQLLRIDEHSLQPYGTRHAHRPS